MSNYENDMQALGAIDRKDRRVMALYVARWCEPGAGNGVNERYREAGKTLPPSDLRSARQIANDSGVSHPTILTLLRVWQSIYGDTRPTDDTPLPDQRTWDEAWNARPVKHNTRNDVHIVSDTDSDLEQAQRNLDYDDSTEPWDIPHPHPETLPRSVETRVTETKVVYDGQSMYDLGKLINKISMEMIDVSDHDRKDMIADLKNYISIIQIIIEKEEGKL